MARRRIRLFNQPHRDNNTADARADEAIVARDRSNLYNQLSLLFLALAFIVLVYVGVTFVLPDHPLNPLPPLAPAMVLTPLPTFTPTTTPTPTATRRPTNTPAPTATATRTPTPSPSPEPTRTPRPGETIAPSDTPTPEPTSTPVATPAPFAYTAEVIYQRAQLYGTNWAGVAGLVFDLNGKYQPNIDVKAWGDEPLGPEGKILPSGTAPQYGPSGWEFRLGNRPAFGRWQVQLIDANGAPLSDVVEIEMQGDPLGNLAYVIFRQVQ